MNRSDLGRPNIMGVNLTFLNFNCGILPLLIYSDFRTVTKKTLETLCLVLGGIAVELETVRNWFPYFEVTDASPKSSVLIFVWEKFGKSLQRSGAFTSKPYKTCIQNLSRVTSFSFWNLDFKLNIGYSEHMIKE